MKKIITIFILISHFLIKAQITDVGFYYSTIPLSKTILLTRSNYIGIQANFSSKSKFSFGVFVFYGANNYQSNYTLKTTFEVQGPVRFNGQEVTTSFSGTQYGFGGSFYYQLLKKQKLIISLGLSPSIAFFNKAKSNYGKIYQDSVTSSWVFVGDFQTNNNYLNLKDNKPDILLINLKIKFQYLITSKIAIYSEPFTSLFSVNKTYNSTFDNFGANFGLCWILKQ